MGLACFYFNMWIWFQPVALQTKVLVLAVLKINICNLMVSQVRLRESADQSQELRKMEKHGCLVNVRFEPEGPQPPSQSTCPLWTAQYVRGEYNFFFFPGGLDLIV